MVLYSHEQNLVLCLGVLFLKVSVRSTHIKSLPVFFFFLCYWGHCVFYYSVFFSVHRMKSLSDFRAREKVFLIWTGLFPLLACLCVLSRSVVSNFLGPMDHSLPDSSFHGILQARIREWVAIPFSGGSSWPRDRTQVSCIAGRFFTIWATREALY